MTILLLHPNVTSAKMIINELHFIYLDTDFIWFRANTGMTKVNGELYEFYDYGIIDIIEKMHECDGLLLYTLLTKKDYDMTISKYYPYSDLVKTIYFKFKNTIPIYFISNPTFGVQSANIMGVDLSNLYISQDAIIRYKNRDLIKRMITFYKSANSIYQEEKNDKPDNNESKKQVTQKTWKEFRDSGLLWFINSILHVFGWAITVAMDDGKVIDAYPARVKFRGFSESSNTTGYKKVSKYLNDNAKRLLEEALEDD